MAKVENTEILLKYRIGNYENTEEMLSLIAVKKALITEEIQLLDPVKKG